MIKVINGKELRDKIEKSITRVLEGSYSDCRKPKLVVIQVGNYEESNRYVRNKEKACERVGIDFNHHVIPEYFLQEDIQAVIRNYNDDPTVDGIIVQLPIKSINYVNEREVLDTIDPKKDVDGLTTTSFGQLLTGEFVKQKGFIPCTPSGVFDLLLEYCLNSYDELKGKNVLIIGKGTTSGRPLVPMFMHYGANVINISSGCSKDERNRYVMNAHIIITCVGKEVIDPFWLNANCVLINVGMHTDENGKLKGDYDLKVIYEKYNSIKGNITVSEIVGSTGILTVSHLLRNVFIAYERSIGK